MEKVLVFLKDESGTTAIEYGLIAAGHLCRDHSDRECNRREPERQVQQRFHTLEVIPLTSLHAP